VKVGAGRETLRLFVAAELPPETLHAIEAWQEKVLAPHEELRLNHALHLTLAFLGDVERDRVDDVVAALQTVPVESCPLRAGAVLFLPEKGKKRVVALELIDAGRLARLQADASRALAATGLYDPPKRPWLPHVTVARFRRPGHPFSLQNVNIPGFCVVRAVLYSSLLERAGAVHTPLADFPAS
jgi:RNA 2',3'-cyclic 3'-phosphodiesterase